VDVDEEMTFDPPKETATTATMRTTTTVMTVKTLLPNA
jgi:hypothetical protein